MPKSDSFCELFISAPRSAFCAFPTPLRYLRSPKRSVAATHARVLGGSKAL